jgi:hypothetical protein
MDDVIRGFEAEKEAWIVRNVGGFSTSPSEPSAVSLVPKVWQKLNPVALGDIASPAKKLNIL